jgi:branched-chain amino acid transport system ATP-binding protein
MSETLLRVENISVRYGLARAVDELSIHVDEGEAVFVVGPNGAGKTTLLRTISGLVPAAGGEIWLGSVALTGKRPWDIVTTGVSHVPQNRRCFGPLSVEENLLMGGYGRGKAPLKAALGSVYDVFPALLEKRKQKAQELSGGQQQMVAIGRALMGNAKLIMLDEPSLGLAPALVDNLGRTLRRVRDELGTAVLLVEQNVELAFSVGTRGYMLRTGRLIGEGGPEDLRGELRRGYLGTKDGAPPAAPAAAPGQAQAE